MILDTANALADSMVDRPIDTLGFNQWRGKYERCLRTAAAEVRALDSTGVFTTFCQKAWEEQRKIEERMAIEAVA